MSSEAKEARSVHHAATKEADPTNPLVAAEYKALRDEILKRVEFRYQLLNLTLISAGTLLGAGLNTNSAPVLLVYPIVGAFLAAGWAHNGEAITTMVKYVREELEDAHTGLGWENYLLKHPDRHFLYRGLGLIYAAGIFLTTQFIALMLGLIKATSAPVDYQNTDLVLLVADVIAILCTIAVLLINRRVTHRSDLRV